MTAVAQDILRNISQNISGKSLVFVAAACLALMAAACGGERDISALPDKNPAPVEIRTRVDRAEADPGDVITFTLEAEYAPGTTLELPDISDKFSEFRIAGEGDVHPVEKDGRFHVERWYKLQADIAGSYVIDPVEVAYTPESGERASLKTPKLFIEINSLLPKEGGEEGRAGEQGAEPEDIRDIKPPVETYHPYRLLLAILAILIVAAALIFLGKKLFDRWRRRTRERRLAPRPAHEEALEALDMLLAKKLIEKGRAREFCFEISEILRNYMHARLEVPAIDMTSEEIIPLIEDDGLVADSLRPLVREFLTGTDLVKFARHRPAGSETDKMIEDARKFINKTSSEAPPLAEDGKESGGDAP